MSSKDDTGLMSEAGLVRHFDADKGWEINPHTLVWFSVFIGITIITANIILV